MIKAKIEYIDQTLDFKPAGEDCFPFPNHVLAREFAYREAQRRGLLVRSITFEQEKTPRSIN